jgi:hypothetical protein
MAVLSLAKVLSVLRFKQTTVSFFLPFNGNGIPFKKFAQLLSGELQ